MHKRNSAAGTTILNRLRFIFGMARAYVNAVRTCLLLDQVIGSALTLSNQRLRCFRGVARSRTEWRSGGAHDGISIIPIRIRVPGSIDGRLDPSVSFSK